MGTVTRTVAFTDLANYTQKVSRTDREGLRKILADHEQLVQPIVERNGGRIVKNLGDSFMVLFVSATDALRAALEIQHMVTGSGGISIRLAMVTGDVEEIEGDAFGEAVNLAARILAQTPSGEIWFGPGTRVCMNAAEIPWESVGRFRLKGIPGEKEIFRSVPKHKCWLPDPLVQAVRSNNLVRIRRGARPPVLPPDPVILLEGFAPGSPALMDAVDSLPVLNPASLWLSAYNIASEDRNQWTESGRGLVIGTPEALEESLLEATKQITRTSGSDTIVLEVGVQADVELVMCGLALPAVPLSDVVSSYFYDLLPDARWVNRSDRSLLRVEVTPSGTRLQAMANGITVNGRAVPSGDAVDLRDDDEIRTPSGTLRFEATNHTYAGLLLQDTEMRLGVVDGTTAELGREPNHPGLAFPDRRGQDNIRWCPGPRAAKARAHGFTLDRALAGRRQAALHVHGDNLKLTPLHERCATYVLRDGRKGLERADFEIGVNIGDRVVAGTTVVAIRHPDSE
ncbi:MAG: adenylate/guanylate cyclase domain-containing protein [Alphaproteobacteria bacterium]|nr:adenylate/guanylate cyclase domain-containing protein [Alphaproteobacteria bacterium]